MELIYTGVGKKVYRDGDRLVKSFDETYSKAGILNEALNQARVEETSLNIPKILGVSVIEDQRISGRSDGSGQQVAGDGHTEILLRDKLRLALLRIERVFDRTIRLNQNRDKIPVDASRGKRDGALIFDSVVQFAMTADDRGIFRIGSDLPPDGDGIFRVRLGQGADGKRAAAGRPAPESDRNGGISGCLAAGSCGDTGIAGGRGTVSDRGGEHAGGRGISSGGDGCEIFRPCHVADGETHIAARLTEDSLGMGAESGGDGQRSGGERILAGGKTEIPGGERGRLPGQVRNGGDPFGGGFVCWRGNQ